MFFGSFSIAAISLLGEYIAKIFEEVKARPIYICKNIIKNGTIETYHKPPMNLPR
jgi:dolichol-phosphate mannosyltransferase